MVAISILTALLAALCSTIVAATPVENADNHVERADDNVERADTHGTPAERAWSSQASAGSASYVNTDGCPGSQIESGKVGPGTWHLYYSSASGGTNCLYVKNGNGKRRYMRARVSGPGTHFMNDEGMYKLWAGSVRIHNMKGKCVSFTAENGNARVHKGPYHCG